MAGGSDGLHNRAGEVCYGNGFVGADIVGVCGFPFEQNRPEPDREIGRIQIGAMRRAVALDMNGAAREGVANEIANGEMGIQRQVRPDKSEAARYLCFDTVLPRVDRA